MSVLITGPTRGLGRALALELAGRDDLLLLGRPGEALTTVATQARAAGSAVEAIPCDLSSLGAVRIAAAGVREALERGTVSPLRALIANAGISVTDTRGASQDGYELTFAVNHLAHAQLISGLLSAFAPPARIVLLGSNTYRSNLPRRLLRVPAAEWRDPIELAQPGAAPGLQAAGAAYSTSKLAILYYAHELQRRAGDGIAVSVYEPGFMPGTSLSREHPSVAQALGRAIGRLPGVSKPSRSAQTLAAIAVDDRWAGLRDGAFVVKDTVRDVAPFAIDRERELRLWEATEELLRKSG